MPQALYIGIDGGGTHSSAVAVTAEGRVAARAQGGGLNFLNDGVPAVKARLEEMVKDLLSQCPGAALKKVCVGTAALDAPGEESTHRLFCGDALSRAQLDLQSDAYIALMGFTRGEPGMIAICGTGSMLLMQDGAGQQAVAGGWGYLLGDAGSGYTLAKEALNRVIAAYEGMGAETALTEAAKTYFGVLELRKLIDLVYDPAFTTKQFAGFARFVLEAAAAGDEAAREIVARNMRLLAAQAARLAGDRPEITRLGLYGGIFRHSALATEAFRTALKEFAPRMEAAFPEYPPELGAVIHLLRAEGICTPKALETMKITDKELTK